MYLNPYFALIISIAIGACGQLSLKAGALQPSTFRSVYFQPYILVGLSSYFIAALFYIYSLKKIPLSVAFPSVSASYAIVTFLSHVIWDEPFGVRQILALCLIGIALFLLSRGG